MARDPAIIKKLETAGFTVQTARGVGRIEATYYANDSKTNPEQKAGSVKQPERDADMLTIYAVDGRGRKALIDYLEGKMTGAKYRDKNGAWRVTTITPVERWAKQPEDNTMDIPGLVAAWPTNGVTP